MPRYAVRLSDGPAGLDAAECAIASREWDGESVCFDGASGDCHLLDDLASSLLGSLLSATPDGVELVDLFQRVLGADEPASVAELDHVRQVLANLERIGLIRQLPA